MSDQMNAVWKPITVGELQFQIDEQNKLIDLLREQIKDQHEKLRDRFAMSALTGMFAGVAWQSRTEPEGMASDAYDYADAMMRERVKK